MASYTTNLNLKKPAGSENVAIGDINNNMDTIDNAYGTLNSNLSIIFNLTEFPVSSLSNKNLNDYKDSGMFAFAGNLTNSPNGNYGVLLVIKSVSATKQIWFPDGTQTIYTRRLYNNVWESWYSINTTIVT